MFLNMIKIYIDGSLNIKSKKEWKAGIGIVLKTIDDDYPDDVISEEYYAYRYESFDFHEFLSESVIYDKFAKRVQSSLFEYIAFGEAMRLVIPTLPGNVFVTIYTDSMNCRDNWYEYKRMIRNKVRISPQLKSCGFLHMSHCLFNDDLDLMGRIVVRHVNAHGMSMDNRAADFLADWSSDPMERVETMLHHGGYIGFVKHHGRLVRVADIVYPGMENVLGSREVYVGKRKKEGA